MATAALTTEIDDEVKRRFAIALLRTNNASQAALQVIPSPGLALQLSYTLPADPVVLAEMDRLREEAGEDSFLPSKAEIAREIYDRAKDCVNVEDYERLMKLYCNIKGYIEKPGTNVNVSNTVVAPVMVVRDHGTDEEWATKVAEQQRRLTVDASA